MAHRYISLHLRFRIARRGLGFALLLFVGLGYASVAHAQGDALSSSPISDVGTIEDAGLRAYVAVLPSAPIPKVEPASSGILKAQTQVPNSDKRTHLFYWLDRTSLTYGLALSGAEIFDGATTRYFIHHCSHCYEDDPMSRLLMGAHPSWGKMIPAGVVEALAATYSYQRLSRSPHRFMRATAPLVPLGLTAVHVIEGARNISLKNKYRCAEPGYIVVGMFCVMAPPPVMTGAAGVAGGGLGSLRNPL
jgi:hypothetical protein